MKLRKKQPVYHFFSGKGGVGKTSLAAATALRFAQQGKQTLIISTDPAHSLSDAFEQQIGPQVKQIGKNLKAVEIDPAVALEEYKEKLAPKIEGMELLKGLGLEDGFDLAGMTPGIDEMAAFEKFLQYMHSEDYDVIVFDTAPTGHTLRFLSLPDVLDSWIGKLIALRMRFSGMIGLVKKLLPFSKEQEEGAERLGMEHLEKMKQRIAEARELLADPQRTRFHIVLIPEEMSILESHRSLAVLKQYRIAVGNVFVNQVIPENSGCDFCSAKRKQQTGRIAAIKEKFKGYPVIQVPLFKEEVKGVQMLERVAAQFYPR